MSLDAMKQALAALKQYTNVVTSVNDPNSWVSVSDGGKPARDAILALRAAIEQAQPELEQAMTDAIIGGTGVMMGDKRIDPASIYKQPEQEPVAWVCYGSASDEKHTIDYRQEDIDAIPVGTMLYPAPRQWQGLTDEESKIIWRDIDGSEGMLMRFARAIEAKLREKNNAR